MGEASGRPAQWAASLTGVGRAVSEREVPAPARGPRGPALERGPAREARAAGLGVVASAEARRGGASLSLSLWWGRAGGLVNPSCPTLREEGACRLAGPHGPGRPSLSPFAIRGEDAGVLEFVYVSVAHLRPHSLF